MMVKWANDGLLQAYDGKMLVIVEMVVNDGEIIPYRLSSQPAPGSQSLQANFLEIFCA